MSAPKSVIEPATAPDRKRYIFTTANDPAMNKGLRPGEYLGYRENGRWWAEPYADGDPGWPDGEIIVLRELT